MEARIDASPGRAVVLAAGATVLALAAFAPPVVMVVAVAVVMMLLVLGWPHLVGADVRLIHLLLVAAPPAVALWAVTMSLRPLEFVMLALAGGVMAAFATELVGWGKSARGLENVSAMVSGQVAGISVAGWVLAHHLPGGPELVLVGAAMLAVAAVTSLLNLGEIALLAASAVIGFIGGAILGGILPAIPVVFGAVIGAGASLVATGTAVLVTGARSMARTAAWFSAAVLPLAAVGLLVFGVGRLLPPM